MMTLYVMAEPEPDGMCKVGITTNIVQRRQTVRSASGVPVVVFWHSSPQMHAKRIESKAKEILNPHLKGEGGYNMSCETEWFTCRPEVAVSAIKWAMREVRKAEKEIDNG